MHIWRTFLEPVVATGGFSDHRTGAPEGTLKSWGGEVCIRTVGNQYRNKEIGLWEDGILQPFSNFPVHQESEGLLKHRLPGSTPTVSG